MKRILLVFTGGTICSSPDKEGKNHSDARGTGSYLEINFKASDSPFSDKVEFDRRYLPTDILSENMTVDTWNDLVEVFKDKSLRQRYEGVVILHGTDTLAYTSALLSILLSGFPIPVCLVSAQLELTDSRTNGYDNFRGAVELIMNGIAPNVYAVYRNLKNDAHEGGELFVHCGAHLRQCPNFSDNFHSLTEMRVPDIKNARLKGRRFLTESLYVDRTEKLSDGVLMITPHTNMRYDRICLDGVRAIVHGTYHAQSVCVGRAENKDENEVLTLQKVREADKPYSILFLLERCEEKGIPVFLAPCDREQYRYGSTAAALNSGAIAAGRITPESAYAKLIVGVSLGYGGKDLVTFMGTNVNGEII